MERENNLKCHRCDAPATCSVWNDFYGKLYSCEKHKKELTQTATYCFDQYGNSIRWIHTSRQPHSDV